MRTVVLISCGKSKRGQRAPAHQLYTGALFQKSLAYARHIKADAIYILSAHYGLLDLEQEVEPYEKTLTGMTSGDIARWAKEVLVELRKRADLANDRFVILAGHAYRSHLIEHLTRVEVPLDRLPLGKQLRFLKLAAD